MSRYLSHLAALTLNQVESVKPRLASRFETPVDKGPSVNDGLNVAVESRVATPAFAQPLRNNAEDRTDRFKPVRPHVGSLFETKVNIGSADTNHLDVALESGVSKPLAHGQASKVTATDQPVTPGVAATSADGQAKKKSSGQDQPWVDAPTGFMFRKSELPGDQQKPSSGQSFASFNTMADTAKARPTARSGNSIVAQTSDKVRNGTQPTESIRTFVERVQEHFTEATHKEFVIREAAAPDANQKTSKTEESPCPAPVKPDRIVVRSEQTTFEPNTPRRTEAQSLSPSSSGTDTTPEPTIQVTIGRIEIRATQVADKPAAKPRSAGNTMSLDDYLNRRNGGKS